MMETILKKHPITEQTVQADRFEVWTWRDGGTWWGACPDLEAATVHAKTNRAEVSKMCFLRVCEIISQSKASTDPAPWKAWTPPTRGMYSVNKFSIA